MTERRKCISFDLDIEILKENYRNKSYENAYREKRNFLNKKGYDWSNGSGYLRQGK